MTVLVTGATGNVGRHLIAELLAAGRPVRALTRHPERADLPDGVEVVEGDLTVPESLGPALDGATALHLITTGGDGFAPLRTGPDIVKLATAAGVRRVTVLWSGVKGPVEEAVEASGLEWTLLQPVEFMSNALQWAESIRTEGVAREPFGRQRAAVVHEADIAGVAATALLEGGHGGRSYTLTGPEALTVPERVAAIGAAIGRELRYVELTEEEARERMRRLGATEEVVDFVVGWHADPPASAYTVVPTVEEVTGRPARTFAQWAAEHADAFRA